MSRWPHSPPHDFNEAGAYIVTAATQYKVPFFHDAPRRDMLQAVLIETLEDLGWEVQAWAVLSNHYHFVGRSPDTGPAITDLTQRLHRASARELNAMDGTPGRSVWYRSWDTYLTYQTSYLARLAYVLANPVRHGVVADSAEWPWCSEAWFYLHAPRPLYETVKRFKTGKVNVVDDF